METSGKLWPRDRKALIISPHLCVNKIKDIDTALESLRDPRHLESVRGRQLQFVFGSAPIV